VRRVRWPLICFMALWAALAGFAAWSALSVLELRRRLERFERVPGPWPETIQDGKPR